MLWLKTFECISCGTVFEDLVGKKEGADCPKCNGKGKELSPTQTSPSYGKHGSWAQWRMDQNWTQKGK